MRARIGVESPPVSTHWAACKVVTELARSRVGGSGGRTPEGPALAVSCSVFAQTERRGRGDATPAVPVADYHQHLCSPELAALIAATPPTAPLKTREASIFIGSSKCRRDQASSRAIGGVSLRAAIAQGGRRRGEGPARERLDERQVARYPERLIGSCGLNPLKDYALDELARCAKDPNLRRGLKLHFGDSIVDYHNPEHIEQVRQVGGGANEHRMAIVVHARASVTQRYPYGRDEALIFLNDLLPAAPDVVVQLAASRRRGSRGRTGHSAGPRGACRRRSQSAIRERGLLYFDITAVGVPARPDR